MRNRPECEPSQRDVRLGVSTRAAQRTRETPPGGRRPETDGSHLRSVLDSISEQAALHPERPALIHGNRTFKYGQLKAAFRRLARRLEVHDVSVGDRVGVLADGSPEAIVAVLSVLQSGATYVPLDALQPLRRLRFILEDTDAHVLLSSRDSQLDLATDRLTVLPTDTVWTPTCDEGPPRRLRNPVGTNDAYVIYTSGSTGAPKGVVVSQANLAFSNIARLQYYDEPVGKFLLLSPLYFDSSVAGLFWTLTTGGTLVLPDAELNRRPQAIAAFMERPDGVTHTLCVPSLWSTVLRQAGPSRLASLRVVVVAGEPCPRRLVNTHQERVPHVALHNEYGPTEGTVWATACRLDTWKGKRIPIGKPIAGMRVYIVDAELSPVVRGQIGEICLAGKGVARGYLGRPDLTANRFVQPPADVVPELRLYRTGDLGRESPSGDFEFVGRSDQQVKVNGFRVELTEVESVLSTHPSVERAAALKFEVGGRTRLVAFVESNPCDTASVPALSDWLHERLPAYMVPKQIIVIEDMPTNSNGKIDRKALEDRLKCSPGRVNGKPRTSYAESTSALIKDALEWTLFQMWDDTLSGTKVDVHTDFFSAGGDSLAAIDLLAKIERSTGVQVNVGDLLAHPTVSGLAHALRQRSPGRRPSCFVPLRAQGDSSPLILVHPGGGNALCYLDLAKELGDGIACYGVQAPGFDGVGPSIDRVEDMASHYIDELRKVQPEGPYHIGGWSFGGVVAFEMARQLTDQGHGVANLIVIDAGILYGFAILRTLLPRDIPLFHLSSVPESILQSPFMDRCVDAQVVPPQASLQQKQTIFNMFVSNVNATLSYRPEPYAGRVELILGTDKFVMAKHDPHREWEQLCDHVELRRVPGHHFTMLKPPHVSELACCLRELLS